MKKCDFDKIFTDCAKEVLESDSPQRLVETLSYYKDEDDTISSQDLVMFAYIESLTKCQQLLYSVLLKVLDVKE